MSVSLDATKRMLRLAADQRLLCNIDVEPAVVDQTHIMRLAERRIYEFTKTRTPGQLRTEAKAIYTTIQSILEPFVFKQKQAFLNLKKNGEKRSELDDRIKCAEKFTEYAAKASRNEVKIKGKRIGLNDFTKEAINLITYNKKNGPEAQILNAQWVNNSLQTGALGKMIAMVFFLVYGQQLLDK